jgi:hypothetical protein
MKLIIIDKDLCLIDESGDKIIKRHKPFSSIKEFKKIGADCIIVREDTNNYDEKKSNIYCLNNNLEMVWFSEQLFENDTFPNEIDWNKELNDNGTSWSDYVIGNPDTLTCSSCKGFTVTIDYKTGKITKSIFTK